LTISVVSDVAMSEYAATPIRVASTPPRPTLEDLLRGQMDLRVAGPSGERVQAALALLDQRGSQIWRQQLGAVELPAPSGAWRQVLKGRGVLDTDKALQALEESESAELALSCRLIGLAKLKLDRDRIPLRWSVIRRHGGEYDLLLHDNTGREDSTRVSVYDLSAPIGSRDEEATSFRDKRPASEGGLFLAQNDGTQTAILVPPGGTLKDVRFVQPRIQNMPRRMIHLKDLLRLAHLWLDARVVGDLLGMWCYAKVRDEFALSINGLLGAGEWKRGELDCLKAVRKGKEEMSAIRCLGGYLAEDDSERRFVSFLTTETGRLPDMTAMERVRHLANGLRWYLPGRCTGSCHQRPSHAYGLGDYDHVTIVADVALRIASDLQALNAWNSEELPIALQMLWDVPIVARAARFWALSLQATLGPAPLESALTVQGWDWSGA